MTEIVMKLKQFRQSLTLQSLIQVNEKMGIPYLINDKTLFIPFFKGDKEKCALSSRLFLQLPIMKIIRFEKVWEDTQILIYNEELCDFKEMAIGSDFKYEIKYIPISIRNIYREAKECI